MASDKTNAPTSASDAQQMVPIAQLCPELPEQSTRTVGGEITVVWPYSLVTKSIAFKLVETDFRLRRDRGQVRIDFHGPAGKAVSDAVLEGGDTVRLRLDGVVWEKALPETVARPGTLEWQLRFTNRLHLYVCRAETRDEVTIDIDAPEAQSAPDFEIPRAITPVNAPSDLGPASPEDIAMKYSPMSSIPPKRLASTTFETDEYASPAFLKRARVSYGSLFEGGLDMLMEGRKDSSRRKRPRFSMNPNWKYSSRTPSPEPEPTSQPEDEDEDEENTPIRLSNSSPIANTRPHQMTVDQARHETVKPRAPTRLSSEPQTTPPTANNTQIPGTFLELERGPGGTIDTELTEEPFVTGYVSLTSDDNILPASAASHTKSSSLEPVQESSAASTQPHGSLSQPQSVASLGKEVSPPVPNMLSDAPRNIATEGPRGDLQFSDSDYHMHIPSTVDDGNSHSLHTAADAIFPLVSDTASPELHPAGPFSSQHSSQIPWTDFLQPSISAYPPVPTQDNHQGPVEIIDSSSPLRRPSEAADALQEPEDKVTHTLEQQAEQLQPGEDFDSEDALEEDRADFKVNESESEDSDLPGEDYDLRNYDGARADDEVEPEDTPEPSSGDPDEQIADLSPRDDLDSRNGFGSDPIGSLVGESDEEFSSGQSANAEAQDFGETDSMGEGVEYGMEEDDYSEDGHDDEGDDEEHAVSKTAVSQEPVVIDLLSDSEDEDEAPAKAASQILAKSDDESAAPIKSPYDKLENNSFEGIEAGASQEDPTSPISEEDEGEYGFGDEKEINAPNHSVVSQLLSAAKKIDSGQDDDMDVDKEGIDGRLFSMDDEDGRKELEASRNSPQDLQPMEGLNFQATNTAAEVDREAAEEFASTGMKESEAKVGSQEERMSDTSMGGSVRGNTDEIIEEVSTEADASTTVPSQGIHQTSLPAKEASTEFEGGVNSSELQTTSPSGNHVQQVTVIAATGGNVGDSNLVEPVMQEPIAQTRHERVLSGLPSQTKISQDIPDVASPDNQPRSEESPASQSLTVEEDPVSKETSKDIISDSVTIQLPSTSDFSVPVEPRQSLPEEEAGQESEPDLDASNPVQAELGSPIQIDPTSPEQHTALLDQTTLDAKTTEDPNTESIGHSAKYSPAPIRSSPGEVSQELDAPSQDLELATEQSPSPEDMIVTVDDGALVSPASTPMDDEVTAEQQIMAESQEYRRILSQPEAGMPGSSQNKDETQRTLPAQGGVKSDKTVKAKPDREVLITVQSLRSWDHRRSTSTDAGANDSLQDPSISLAKAPAPSATKPSREEARPRTAASYQSQDPSIALARASAPSTAAASREDAKSRMTVHITRSMVDHSDPSLDLARAPSTPRKSARKHTTPDRSLDMPALSQSMRDKTPDTPATTNDVMNTPSVVGSTAEDEQVSTLKRKLNQDLRNNLSEYVQLKAIRNHQKKTMEVIGVVTKTPLEPYRPKSGPRDYLLEVIITDPAAAPNNVVVAQLFRPHKTSLPTVQAGDVVILRQFQTHPLNKRGVGLRTVDESSWAVFEKGDEEMLPQIKGPPVEVSDAEVAHAEGLRRWWGLLDGKARDKIAKATEKVVQNPKTSTK